jgi:hypothetical protein
MTTIIAAMQDSILTLESSKTGWKTKEYLKRTSPQCVAYDPRNSNRVYCGTFGDRYGRQMIVGKLGAALERSVYLAKM